MGWGCGQWVSDFTVNSQDKSCWSKGWDIWIEGTVFLVCQSTLDLARLVSLVRAGTWKEHKTTSAERDPWWGHTSSLPSPASSGQPASQEQFSSLNSGFVSQKTCYVCTQYIDIRAVYTIVNWHTCVSQCRWHFIVTSLVLCGIRDRALHFSRNLKSSWRTVVCVSNCITVMIAGSWILPGILQTPFRERPSYLGREGARS